MQGKWNSYAICDYYDADAFYYGPPGSVSASPTTVLSLYRLIAGLATATDSNDDKLPTRR